MTKRVKVTGIELSPGDRILIDALAEGVPVRFTIARAELQAAGTKQAKRRLLAEKALAQLDNRVRGNPYEELFGDIDI